MLNQILKEIQTFPKFLYQRVRQRSSRVIRWWKDLAVAKKLYTVVGLMAILIVGECFTLFFAMHTLSAARACVAGEGLWSKAQKNAILSLYQYTLDGDEKYFAEFKHHLEITDADHFARLELSKPNFDFLKVREGYLKGGNDPSDVNGMIGLLIRFHRFHYIQNAVAAWSSADLLLDQLHAVADKIHGIVQTEGKKSARLAPYLEQVSRINAQLTVHENAFSEALGAGSRMLENLLIVVLLITVFTVEGTGIFLTCLFSRNFSQNLQELTTAAYAVGKGDFSHEAPVRAKDEMGQLATALNKMVQDLRNSIAKNATAEAQLRQTQEQFRVQRQLETSESKLHQVVEAAPNGLLMVDQQGKIVLCNAKIESLFGYRREELLGMQIEILVPERFRKSILESRLEYIARPETFQSLSGWNITGLCKNGEEFSIEIGLNPVNTDAGHFVLASVVDVTERKKIAHDLAEAKQAAESASRAKSAFLANMSHEIRTPLGVMIGFADLISDPDIGPRERNQFAQTLKRNGELLTLVINDILDLSKVEAGHMVVEALRFSLRSLLDEVVATMKIKASEKSLRLRCKIESSVPDEVTTDPTRLRQILYNVIGNAIKFTNKGDVSLFVKKSKEQILIDVQDTGIGLLPEHQAGLFQSFHQADETTTRKFGGTGLGLALSKRLSQLLDGDLVLKESRIGRGSTFQIRFKMQLSASGAEKMNPTLPRGIPLVETAIRLDGMLILLVEDSPDNQQLIALTLSKKGARVELASNGDEGVHKALAGKHDIVLMDVQMPVLDGYSATQQLRGAGFRKPIIALTAHAMSEVREKCMNVGYSDYLPKPLNSVDLVRTIARYAGRELEIRHTSV